MTDYVTLTDLLDYPGQEELAQVAGLGSHNLPEGRSLDEDKINAQIAFTNDLIGGYLAKRYPIVATLTSEQVPELIRGFACDIVRYRLRARSGDRNAVTEEVRIRYDDAVKWLKDASRGLVNVPFDEGVDDGSADASPAGQVRASLQPSNVDRILEGYGS